MYFVASTTPGGADIETVFERCRILRKYNALPYIMRYKAVYESRWRGMYSNLAAWCNQPSFFRKKTFRAFCEIRGKAARRYMEEFEQEYPEIAKEYFDGDEIKTSDD